MGGKKEFLANTLSKFAIVSSYCKPLSAKCVFNGFVGGFSDKTMLQVLKSEAALGTSVWLNATPNNPAQETATLNSY